MRLGPREPHGGRHGTRASADASRTAGAASGAGGVHKHEHRPGARPLRGPQGAGRPFALVAALAIRPIRRYALGISERVFLLAVNVFYLGAALGLALA
ncbi:hypothetical protein OHJ16_15565 [Actinomyces israelii]|uniref:Uncharacterized protein n=1 Tax=Actinomyces israelii TaxID=1659 RepID=A0ABT4IDW8_9ACTO|nr:hypothetical protein [Actinomyces israelii]MCZ0859452.1 hypothetical protein [Actinomyces israelii]